MSNEKRRGPGRPPGSRNKVNIEKDVTRALNSGLSMTQIKEFIEAEMKKYSEAGDAKNAVGMLKHLLDLVKYLTKLELDFDKEKEVDPDTGDEDGDDDNVTALDFSRKAKRN